MSEQSITEILTFDTARVLNQLVGDWEKGWLTVYKRHKYELLFNTFNPTFGQLYTSTPVFCAPYSKGLILIGYTEAGADAHCMQIWPAFAPDKEQFHRGTEFEYATIAGTFKEARTFDVIGEYFRVELIDTGVSCQLITNVKVAVILQT